MARILYGLAILFLIIWTIGFFLYGLGLIIHLALFAGLVAVIIKLIKEK